MDASAAGTAGGSCARGERGIFGAGRNAPRCHSFAMIEVMEVVMRLLFVSGAVALAFIVQVATEAQAREYPWCARYDWTTYNCGFVSLRQCLATISGVGGRCEPNRRYVGEPVRRHKRPRY